MWPSQLRRVYLKSNFLRFGATGRIIASRLGTRIDQPKCRSSGIADSGIWTGAYAYGV
jgi:hypothetical protein